MYIVYYRKQSVRYIELRNNEMTVRSTELPCLYSAMTCQYNEITFQYHDKSVILKWQFVL